MQNKTLAFMRENPVPFIGVIGLLSGAIVRFVLARPDIADVLWLLVLVVGGAPTVLKTIQKMLKGNFAADVVAMLGCVDISAQPNQCAGKLQKARVAAPQLVKARKDPTKMLDLVDETFDQVALTIQPMIIITRLLGILTRGNHDFCTAFHDQCDKILSVIAAIGDHMLQLESVDQVGCLGDVMTLPSSQAQTQRIAQAIDSDVDFGAKSTATAPQRQGKRIKIEDER